MKTPTQGPLTSRAVLTVAALLAAGCQDYNFNPVGHCLITPARERFTLEDISTADVLFVVDDSGSMKGEQEALGQGFKAFIDNLDRTNKERRLVAGLEPIDFHIAVTTSSIFINNPTTAFCRNDCPQAVGAQVCCETSGSTPLRPMRTVKRCAATAECGGGALVCAEDCNGFLGEKVCCDSASKVPPVTEPVACDVSGAACGALQTHYRYDAATCGEGVATNGALYPAGSFVGYSQNPRVLHFDKELYPELDAVTQEPIRDAALPPCSDGTKVCNRQGFTSSQLIDWFASQVGGAGPWQGNVIAGTCGSGQEQALEAARQAIRKAQGGQQKDLVDARGGRPAAGQPLPAADWLHDDSKLVVVFVGDEDDCSSPVDPVRGVILTGSPGRDACVADAALDPAQQKQFKVKDIVDELAGLGRPLGAAFIVSTAQSACEDATCSPGLCCPLLQSGPTPDNPNAYACSSTSGPVCSTSTCGGQGPGFRLLDAATQLRAKNADVVSASICDSNFDQILNRVADIVKPPPGLLLPTQPAASEVAVLRIARADGSTRETCRGPAPATLTAAEANAQGYDWWFTRSREQVTEEQKQPFPPSRYVYINSGTPTCKANPGETYSADYLGQVPAGGCQTRSDCWKALGGSNSPPYSWTCFAGKNVDGTYVQPTAEAPGSCVCGDEGAGSF